MSRADSPLLGRVIFNVGSRRSGTFWLQRVVAAHPEVDAVPPETHLFSHGLAVLFDRVQHDDPGSLQVGAIWAEREVLLDAARDFCDRLLDPYASSPGHRISERTPVHAFHLELISAVYPDARVVHIIRDGRDVARSIAGMPWGPSTIGGAAVEWRSAVEAARADGLPPDRYREVRYESLLADPEHELAELLRWLGLEHEGEALTACMAEAGETTNVDPRSAGVGSGKWRSAYTPADLDAFLAAAGDLLSELGYDASERPQGGSRPRGEAAIGGRSRRRRRLANRAMALADPVAGALVDATPEPIVAALASGALVSAETSGGRNASGPDGGAAVLRWFGAEGGFRGREVDRAVYPGDPWTTVVLVIERDDGARADRAFALRARRGKIAELVLYAFPRESREPVFIGIRPRE